PGLPGVRWGALTRRRGALLPGNGTRRPDLRDTGFGHPRIIGRVSRVLPRRERCHLRYPPGMRGRLGDPRGAAAGTATPARPCAPSVHRGTAPAEAPRRLRAALDPLARARPSAGGALIASQRRPAPGPGVKARTARAPIGSLGALRTPTVVIALAAHLFHGPDRLEGVRGDFGNLAVADIEDSEAAV